MPLKPPTGVESVADPIETVHSIHQGPIDRHSDAEARICVDCLVGIGLLQLADRNRDRSIASRLRAGLSSLNDNR